MFFFIMPIALIVLIVITVIKGLKEEKFNRS